MLPEQLSLAQAVTGWQRPWCHAECVQSNRKACSVAKAPRPYNRHWWSKAQDISMVRRKVVEKYAFSRILIFLSNRNGWKFAICIMFLLKNWQLQKKNCFLLLWRPGLNTLLFFTSSTSTRTSMELPWLFPSVSFQSKGANVLNLSTFDR